MSWGGGGRGFVSGGSYSSTGNYGAGGNYSSGSGSGGSSGMGGYSSQPVPRKGTSIETHMAQMGYGMGAGGMGSRGYGSSSLGKRRVKSEEEYFDDDEEEAQENLEYQPAPGSPSATFEEKYGKGGGGNREPVVEDDPLDAYMAGIQTEVERQSKTKTTKKERDKKKGIRDDIENEDDLESYFRFVEEHPQLADDNEADIEYDAEGNAIIPEYRKIIDPLPPLDHSTVNYVPFNKNFYQEHLEITALSVDEIIQLRNKLNLKVSGILPAKPVTSFAHFGFENNLMKSIRKAGYTQPTPIQAQGVPVAMGGRDIIGIAKTGSGKTAAYLWPLMVHIMDQPQLKAGEGPIGIILAPTRELSQQIYHEAKKFGKVYNIHVVCAYGGGSMWEQCKACEEGAEVIVATPGRLIDLVKKKATNLTRVSYLVFDEADRMFDMGFEAQVRSIANHVRPDRQTLLFSATFRRRVERLARDILNDPIRVVQGELGEANEDVTQIVKVLPPGGAKWKWLTSRLVEFTSTGSVLIFVTRKANSEELANNLKLHDHKLGLLHGDMNQNERNEIITAFKRREMPILVATDVAARGLDIPCIRVVVNFDVARDIDTHTHRIGRTGRAGEKGTAYTLITAKDKDFAGHLVRNLETASQIVPPELMDLAMQNPWFKKTRFRAMKAKQLNIGGAGLGLRERPGLGAAEPASTAGVQYYQPSQGRTTGPQSDRICAMKSAFMAQFKSNFVTSSDPNECLPEPEPEPEPAPMPPPAAPVMSGFVSSSTNDMAAPGPPPESKRRKKSRWE